MDRASVGKEKAASVRLDYFLAPLRRKPFAWIAAAVVAVVAAGSVFGYWKKMASPGPIHASHAAWENDCAACHAGPFQPTGSRNAMNVLAKLGLLKVDHTKADQLCKNCHEGPAHSANQRPDEVGSCSSCHIDHQGRYADIVGVPDKTCTRCHADIKSHVADAGKMHFGENVTSFIGNAHPEFRIGPPDKREPLSKAKDPGHLRFNHELHLMPGVAMPKDNDSLRKTLKGISDPILRERYRSEQPEGMKSDDSLVQLTCASCHKLDEADGKVIPNKVSSAAGDYMLPIKFNEHCKGCHPLTFDSSLKGTEVPHGIQLPAVRDFLRGVYTSDLVKGRDETTKRVEGGKPLPGHNLSREEAQRQIDTRVNDLYGKITSEYTKHKAAAFIRCSQCHDMPEPKDGEKLIRKPDVPEVWLPHARFSHRSHRANTCQTCHAPANTSKLSSDVMIPNLAKCQECHAPAGTDAQGHRVGGVDYNCTTCHKYHHGDSPGAGRGAAARAAKTRRDRPDFLGTGRN